MATLAYLTPDNPTSQLVCRVFHIPIEFNPAFTGALETLTDEFNWQEFGDLTAEQAAEYAFNYIQSEDDCSMRAIGSIVAWMHDTIPDYLVVCQGQIIYQVDYPLLWDVFNTNYKNPATGGMLLPNMNDHFISGTLAVSTLVTGGATWKTLSEENLPTHKHTISNGYGPSVVGGYIGEVPAMVANPTSTDTTAVGSGTAFDNRPSYYSMIWCMVAK